MDTIQTLPKEQIENKNRQLPILKVLELCGIKYVFS